MELITDKEKRIRLYFRRSILIKGAISFAEVVAGTLAFFIPTTFLSGIILNIAEQVPVDFLSKQLISFSTELAVVSNTFLGVYLILRGLIKFGLIIALLRHKLWAYPWSIAIISMLISYQFYQMIVQFSWFIVLLTLFDLVVVWFIWQEYVILKTRSRVVEGL